jgi:hypothetical protein
MKIRFSALVEVPDGTPMADVERWIAFCIGAECSLAGHNALSHTDLQSSAVELLTCGPD